MKAFLDLIERVLRLATTTLFGLLIIPVTLQILARYVEFVPRYIWTEEVARFCFIWIIMLGAMIAVRHDAHFEVDVLPRPTTAFGAGISRAIVHVAIFALALCFIYFGIGFSQEGAMQTSEIASLPMLSIYIAWPFAGVIWSLLLIETFSEDFAMMRGHRPQEEERV
jgi:TRAP-type C4-dicarboxylate transport system permease small subunit